MKVFLFLFAPLLLFSQDFFIGLSYKEQTVDLNLEKINRPILINALMEIKFEPILIDLSIGYQNLKATDIAKIEHEIEILKTAVDLKFEIYNFEPFIGLQLLWPLSYNINLSKMSLPIGNDDWVYGFSRRTMMPFFRTIGISYNFKLNHDNKYKISISKNAKFLSDMGKANNPVRNYSFWEFSLYYHLY